jgi:hypothetical protein
MNSHTCEIKCPFFRAETEKTLRCERCQVGIKNLMTFRDKKQKVKYLGKYCMHFPNECHVFKAAWENRS